MKSYIMINGVKVECEKRYSLEKSKFSLSFSSPKKIAPLRSWIMHAWHVKGENKSGVPLVHYGARLLGLRFDIWIVKQKGY